MLVPSEPPSNGMWNPSTTEKRILKSSGVDPETLASDTLMNPKSVAEAYWNLHHQTRDGWTFEMDIRPFAETW